MNVKQYFLGVNCAEKEIIEASFCSGYETTLVNLFQFVDDLVLWESIIGNTTDTTILVSAIKEYELSFQAIVSGQYRYAFMAKRYFIEQISRFVYLSTNELYLRHWKLGIKDVAWGSIADEKNGIFSKIFIRAFFSDVQEEGRRFQTLSAKLYRESSEFVHGNFAKANAIPRNMEFQPDMLGKWLEYMETGKLIAMFLLFMRFSKDLSEGDLARVETMAQDELCDIDGFESLFK